MRALVDKFGVWLDFDFLCFFLHRSFLEKLVMTVQYLHDYKTDLLICQSFPGHLGYSKPKCRKNLFTHRCLCSDPSYLVGGSTHCCTDNVCGHALLLYFKLYMKYVVLV